MQNTQMYLQIIAGVAIILFLVATAMSYRTWRVHTLLLMFAIFFAAGTYYALSVPLLKTHQAWREHHRDLGKELAEVEQRNQELAEGVVENGKLVRNGIKQLHDKEVVLLMDRGRRWSNCAASAADAKTGVVTVTIPEPSPHQIKKNMVLWAFDDRSYLGKFFVASVVGGEGMGAEAPAPAADPTKPEPAAAPDDEERGPSVITLEPAWRPSERELTRIRGSAGPWTLYDKMPADSHELFVDIDKDPLSGAQLRDPQGQAVGREQGLRALFPEGSVAEYARDHTPAKADDPPERVAVKVQFLKEYSFGAPGPAGADSQMKFERNAEVWLLKNTVKNAQGVPILGADDLKSQGIVRFLGDEPPRYVRPLRDYEYFFREMHLDRERLNVAIEDLVAKAGRSETVFKQNVVLNKSLEEETARLAHDKQRFAFDLNAISAHLAALNQQFAEVRAVVVKLFHENQRLVAEIDRRQRAAAAAIDQRTPSPREDNLLSVPPRSVPAGT